MKSQWKAATAAILCLQIASLFCTVAGAASAPFDNEDREGASGAHHDGWMVEVGKDAPQFALKDEDGRVWKLSSFSDKPVLLFFWGSW